MSDSTRPHVKTIAQCACGDVSLMIDGTAWTTMLCTCRNCQKASGSGHSALAIFDAEVVTCTGALKSFSQQANSGATLTRYFCPECGTPVYGRTSRNEAALIIPVGLFDDTSWYEPKRVIFTRSHNEWDVLPDIPRHDTYPEQEDA